MLLPQIIHVVNFSVISSLACMVTFLSNLLVSGSSGSVEMAYLLTYIFVDSSSTLYRFVIILTGCPLWFALLGLVGKVFSSYWLLIVVEEMVVVFFEFRQSEVDPSLC